MVANYTFAHSIDDLSSTFADNLQGASGGIGNLGYLDPRNPGLDRGNSDYDIRHRVVVSPIYETPWFKQSGGWSHLLLGGYTFTSIFTARTGTPFGVFDSTNSANAGGGYGWPRYVPGASITGYSTGIPISVGVDSFNMLNLPAAKYYGIQSDNRVLGLWSISRNYDSSQCVSWSWRVVIRSLGSQELPHRRTYESGIPSRGIQHSQPSQLLRERRESRCTQLRYRRTHPSAGEERWTRNASDRRQSR